MNVSINGHVVSQGPKSAMPLCLKSRSGMVGGPSFHLHSWHASINSKQRHVRYIMWRSPEVFRRGRQAVALNNELYHISCCNVVIVLAIVSNYVIITFRYLFVKRTAIKTALLWQVECNLLKPKSHHACMAPAFLQASAEAISFTGRNSPNKTENAPGKQFQDKTKKMPRWKLLQTHFTKKRSKQIMNN